MTLTDELWRRARDACARMRASGIGAHVHDVRLAGRDVRLVLHGAGARDTFTWPFVPAHDGAPDLIVDVWDGVDGAALTWPPDAGRDVSDARRQVFWEPHWVFGFDLEIGRAFLSCPDARAVPSWSIAHPLLKLFHPWLRTFGRHVVHAGAVGLAGRGVLVVGASGSGKSTLSIASAHAGLDYLGDDYVALDAATLEAHALYRIAKLAPDHLAARLPSALARALPPRPEVDKRLLAIEPSPDPLRVVAIIVPEVTGASTSRLAPIGPGRALRALAPSTLLQLPGFESDFKVMADVVRRAPALHLPLGADLPGAVAEIRRIVEAA